MHKFLEMARDYAIQHKFDDDFDYRLCSIIVRGGKVLSVGYNKRSKNSFVRFYQKGVRDFCAATHSEQHAVLQARNKIDLTGSKMYVVRIMANNEFAMSRSCDMCQLVLRNYGITRVYYSINNENYGLLKLSSDGNDIDEIF